MTRQAPTRILLGLLALTMAVAFLATHGPFARDSLPTERQWNSDVEAAMKGSKAYVARMVETTPGPLAINLDIDNTSLATNYRPGAPIEAVLDFVKYAKSLGVAIAFNTGRHGAALAQTNFQLTRAGYPVDQLCGRTGPEESLKHGKQRCRDEFIKMGYRLIANVGNRPTDFVGGGYDRAYRLPNYDGELS